MTVSLLPEKHVRTSESLLGIGAIVLSALGKESKTLDSLWEDLQQLAIVKQRIHGSITLDSVVLAIDFLFAIGAVSLNNEGLLEHAAT